MVGGSDEVGVLGGVGEGCVVGLIGVMGVVKVFWMPVVASLNSHSTHNLNQL